MRTNEYDNFVEEPQSLPKEEIEAVVIASCLTSSIAIVLSIAKGAIAIFALRRRIKGGGL
jgi:hypothetical protein